MFKSSKFKERLYLQSIGRPKTKGYYTAKQLFALSVIQAVRLYDFFNLMIISYRMHDFCVSNYLVKFLKNKFLISGNKIV